MSARFLHVRREDADGLVFDTDPARLDVGAIHRLLSGQSYWVTGISQADVVCAIAHSLNFGVYRDGVQLAFARVVTDTVGFAWLCDVYVEPLAQGAGLGKRLLAFIQAHPQLQDLRRWMLATRDAHALYAQFGFKALASPARYMECLDPTAVGRRAAQAAHDA